MASPRPDAEQARRPSRGVPEVQARPRRSWRPRLRRLVGRALLLALLGPLLLIVLFRFVPPVLTPLMVIRLIQGYGLHREWIAYEDIAPALAQAVISAEDNLFCEETLGFDFAAMRGQIETWSNGERPRGASTITMQTAKNLLLWPGRDPVRKVVEAWLTPQIAVLWPKRRVLEVYLNIVEFGPGVYGAGTAARRFFGKVPSQLSPREAALLAAVLPRPLEWSAASPAPHVRQRAAIIERRVGQIRPLLACAR
ncbi:Biosynthetic peptidoglycan transglycosylase [Rhodovastum atsumiense]|uniref:Biosynthetic peptidoglycan transglycosylase n=1 Tax=Rhodovastum atsumiense TaxID=504468 RepID=A0A5M6IVH7_9PROT|nr:monofunctional biosynthetic peptidoglycan transglycosylase [Rhodovastum atsumiense]KAA5611929.1 monofunctional biosynthetic peptidoglycan transglycosylase [Rhodovastum atsumiense]CAH2598693.1 Biosynthetic peptidoglycan transglycosylase [Rhodovastum atsumiense]